MAEEKNEELSLEGAEGAKGSKKKLIIIIVAAVLLLAGGVGAFIFFTGDDSESKEEEVAQPQQSAEKVAAVQAATYIPMPMPFVFNVMEGKRARLVQIKVQLLVRGRENELLVKKHVPLLQDTLVRVFAAATAEQLRSPAGKTELREFSLQALNEATTKYEKKALIDSVLFTGFVLQ
jgi:flagellar FliL protein